MPYKSVDELPQDLKDKMPQDAQQHFMAAFNAAQDDGMSEDGARQLAMDSLKNEYEQGANGQWQRKPLDTNIHNKSHPTGGN